MMDTHPEAVLERNAADSDGLEQGRDILAVRLRIEGGTGRRILRRSEVRDGRRRRVNKVVVVSHDSRVRTDGTN